MKCIMSMALVCMFTAGAATAQGPVALLPSPLVMPGRIGPMIQVGTPHKYDDPRLGMSYQYSGEGLSLTVYVYDTGNSELPDGADTIPSCQEFEIAKQGVNQAYQKATLKSEYLVRLNPPDEFPQMREALYEYEREGQPTISFIWVTTVAKHFVKLRMSLNAKLRDEVPDARKAVLSTVGEAIKPHLKPVDPKAEPPGTSLNVNALGGSDDDMASGLMYLVLLSAVAEQAPELVPVCGGEFVPGYDAELDLYRGMIAMNGEDDATRSGKQLAKVEKAGFLEEFVWVELHRESWGETAPSGLTLPEYQAWRKKNLKRFKPPSFGSVVVQHPRALPPEPVAP
ncbi:MAG TPA: hypothetical protein VIV63_14000 [Steroidobacteraceae bacterium]